jgi:ribosomal protein S27AE
MQTRCPKCSSGYVYARPKLARKMSVTREVKRTAKTVTGEAVEVLDTVTEDGAVDMNFRCRRCGHDFFETEISKGEEYAKYKQMTPEKKKEFLEGLLKGKKVVTQ